MLISILFIAGKLTFVHSDKLTKGIINIASDKVGIPLGFSDFNSSSKKSMNEISLEIIDRLTNINKKALFIMEDIHDSVNQIYETLVDQEYDETRKSILTLNSKLKTINE